LCHSAGVAPSTAADRLGRSRSGTQRHSLLGVASEPIDLNRHPAGCGS